MSYWHHQNHMAPMIRSFVYISLGAILGANLRYVVVYWTTRLWGTGFPYGTLAVNLVGCLLIGFVLELAVLRGGVSPQQSLFFVVGFLGSFTTFSAYGWESIFLFRGGALALGLLYIVASNVLGLLAVMAGLGLAHRVAERLFF